MKKLNILIVVMLSFLAMGSLSSQAISIAGQLGWSVPGGSGVSDEAEDLNLDGGLTLGFDAIYHFSDNLGVGIVLNRSALAGAGGGDVDLFGLRIFGLKGHFRLKDEGFTPYAALTLGLAQLNTPEYTINNTVVEEQTGNGFGIMPEVGLQFGGVFIGAQYMVPVKYTIEEAFIDDKALGLLNINIGYRYFFNI